MRNKKFLRSFSFYSFDTIHSVHYFFRHCLLLISALLYLFKHLMYDSFPLFTLFYLSLTFELLDILLILFFCESNKLAKAHWTGSLLLFYYPLFPCFSAVRNPCVWTISVGLLEVRGREKMVIILTVHFLLHYLVIIANAFSWDYPLHSTLPPLLLTLTASSPFHWSVLIEPAIITSVILWHIF